MRRLDFAACSGSPLHRLRQRGRLTERALAPHVSALLDAERDLAVALRGRRGFALGGSVACFVPSSTGKRMGRAEVVEAQGLDLANERDQQIVIALVVRVEPAVSALVEVPDVAGAASATGAPKDRPRATWPGSVTSSK